MALATKIVEYAFVCDDCGNRVQAASHEPKDMPTGYHLHVRRVTDRHHHSVSGPLFFCTKDCLINAMRFRISHLTEPQDVT